MRMYVGSNHNELIAMLIFVKIGINLSDPVFRGIYRGKRAHDDDLDDVVRRAVDMGCQKMMVTGSDLKESVHAVEIAEKYRTTRPPSPLVRC